ncbi:hypothetical protein THAOC_32303 [Thalassiosira oceanica]|uniref:MYND-type domain-containing protein n=1 Tax=Thalassiosira oceanica TaxID=159749 RepID=K0RQ91_THAOC|nr:hypothetical protein THAOC_32303 [Thalassiosira oceanica]|eukprot:EJK48867.1 hypothetical protein THAOC_32303 [Thalassiosira oceanica]
MTPTSAMNCEPVDDGGDNSDEVVCANCGKNGSDIVKLKSCTACRLVKYCGVDCQRAHRKQHKKACKQRVAELKDEKLYSQGLERPEGDFCSICTLPIPMPMNEHSSFKPCCMKQICDGCSVAAQIMGMDDCPFCRAPISKNDADILALVKKRMDARDPAAFKCLGDQYFFGTMGLEKNVPRAIELWTEAAELGSIEAHYRLGTLYFDGLGVTRHDNAKTRQYFEAAAMKGHVGARHNLGSHEFNNRNYKRAVRHWLISAKMGDEDSLDQIKHKFARGHATKAQYTEALKGYQDAVEEMKSHDRDVAKAFQLENRK